MKLSDLPRNILFRTNLGILRVQIRHVEQRIQLQVKTRYLTRRRMLPPDARDYAAIADAGLALAARVLDAKRGARPVYGEVGNGGLVSIWVSDQCTGAEALRKLPVAVGRLRRRAEDLLRTISGRLRLVAVESEDWF